MLSLPIRLAFVLLLWLSDGCFPWRDNTIIVAGEKKCPLDRHLQDLPDITDPYYFRQLRKVGTVLEDRNNLYRVQVPDSNKEYILGELNAYIPFTSDGIEPGPSIEADGFAALLAVYHFNNIKSSPILDPSWVEGCPNLKFTMTLLDIQSKPIESTRLFTQMLESNVSIKTPVATGIVGAYRSVASLPLAILSGVNGIPQISPSSTANDFDNKEMYPLFGRTVTNTNYEARVAVEFFASIGSTHVVVLYITDTYGSSLQKSFQDQASKVNITTAQVAVKSDVTANSSDVKLAIQQLLRSKYRHVYAICFEQQLEAIMGEAEKSNAVGADYFWLFPGITPDNLNSIEFKTGSAVSRALNGAGFINSVGGIVDTNLIIDFIDSESTSNMHAMYDQFIKAWESAHEDARFVQYVKENLPPNVRDVKNIDTLFMGDHGAKVLFLYDAIAALLLGMCKAFSNEELFTGAQAFEKFRSTDFYGASGLVKVDNQTGTRDYQTLRWTVWNTHVNETADGYVIISFVPSYLYQKENWTTAVPFEFASGLSSPPSSLPPPQLQGNYIDTIGRAIGYTFMSITLASSLASIFWVIRYHEDYVVVSSQPLFLVMISVGTFIMALTIIPLGLEESVIDNTTSLSKACMSVPWLYFIGASFGLSAIFAKIQCVYKAYKNPDINCILVSDRDLLVAFGNIFLVNLIILVCWTTISPLYWTREYSEVMDSFGRFVETNGRCLSDNQVVYWSLLAIFNLGVLGLCNWRAYTSRNIETEFDESVYVAVSAAAVLQAWAMGIPIIVVVATDTSPAFFYVAMGIVFVTSQTVISLIYIPKVLALRKAHKKLEKEKLEKEKLEAAYSPSKLISDGNDCIDKYGNDQDVPQSAIIYESSASFDYSSRPREPTADTVVFSTDDDPENENLTDNGVCNVVARDESSSNASASVSPVEVLEPSQAGKVEPGEVQAGEVEPGESNLSHDTSDTPDVSASKSSSSPPPDTSITSSPLHPVDIRNDENTPETLNTTLENQNDGKRELSVSCEQTKILRDLERRAQVILDDDDSIHSKEEDSEADPSLRIVLNANACKGSEGGHVKNGKMMEQHPLNNGLAE